MNKPVMNWRMTVMRYENILAALGGMGLDKAIQCTRGSLDQQWQPSQLVVSTANVAQRFTT